MFHAEKVSMRFGEHPGCAGCIVRVEVVEIGMVRHVVVVERPPSKDGVVVGSLDDFLLKTEECRFSFPVEDRHVDAEKTHQGVSQILGSRCC